MPRGYDAKIPTKNGLLVIHGAGVIKMLYSQEVAKACSDTAEKIANKAGTGYIVEVVTGKDRKSAIVKPGTEEATRDNMKNNTLLKAVNG